MEYEDPVDALHAKENMHESELGGRIIIVKYADERRNREKARAGTFSLLAIPDLVSGIVFGLAVKLLEGFSHRKLRLHRFFPVFEFILIRMMQYGHNCRQKRLKASVKGKAI